LGRQITTVPICFGQGCSKELEAQTELIDISRIYQYTMSKDIPANQALYMLALERCLYCYRFNDHIAGEDKTHDVLITGDIL